MNHTDKDMKYWEILSPPFTDGTSSCGEQVISTRRGFAQFSEVSYKTQSVPKSAGKSSLQLSLFQILLFLLLKSCTTSVWDSILPLTLLFSLPFSLSLPSLGCWAENFNFWPAPGASCFGRPAPRETKCFLWLKGNNMAVW